jgi:Na+/H+-dicarboxylate symporter
MFKTFTDGNILQTMVIAVFLGFAILTMKNQKRKETLINFFGACNDMIFKYIGFIMKLAPIGVLFLMANTFGKYGINVLGSMAQLIGTFYVGLFVQIFLVYGLAMWIFARINPFTFLKKSSSLWSFTIASCSSSASIPVSIENAKTNFSIPERIANFCIPLGAQMNTDGTALMFTAVLIFIGQIYGLDYSFGTLLKMVLVGSLLSSSGGGIPGGGVVKLLIIVEAFSLPTEFIGVIAGFYRLLDMGSTTCNCLGDLAGTVIVTKSEERRAKRLGINFEEA